MNARDFIRLGVPLGEATRRATDFVSRFVLGGGDKTRLEEEVRAIVSNPASFTEDDLRGEFAKALLRAPPPPRAEASAAMNAVARRATARATIVLRNMFGSLQMR